MSDDEIRHDGTVICPVHGMRYDPALSEGCIRCPRASPVSGGAKRAGGAPRSVAPSSAPPSSIAAGSRRPSAFPLSTPPIPFEPAQLGSSPYQSPRSGGGGPVISLLPTPERRQSRRGLVQAILVTLVGGTGAAAWFLRPESATDWSTKVADFRYGPNAALTGAMFIPTIAAERPCPLLLLVDNTQHAVRSCARFAKHCEQHGVIAVASDAFGGTSRSDDHDSAALLLEFIRANANVDATRPFVCGFDVAGEVALRLALLSSGFSGAILECTGLSAWRDVSLMARADVAYFLFTRTGDTDRESMVTMKDEMQRKGLRVTMEELPGAHQPMDHEDLDPAFAWMESVRG